ncbi:MAG: phenylalanine--tRNA ligase beta subunit-related protein [Kiloniellales bacterium]|nr:phenylalanine--tRNA ligase beta subunit-related protein [Kiloniellales bacterium]
MRCSINDIVGDFPDTQIAFVLARNVKVSQGRSPDLASEILKGEKQTLERYRGQELASIPEIHDWRRAYKGFGIKKTSYRSSVERLLKNLLAGRPLAEINSLVDAYNLISLLHLVPIGADDLECVEGDICFRRSREGDEFLPLASDGLLNDPPKANEVVYADSQKILCRRWNWQQDRRSPVTTASRNVVLTVQGQASADIGRATLALCSALERHCEAQTRYAITDHTSPVTELRS